MISKLTFLTIGCSSLLGLERNHEMRTLFIQENLIRKIEGLENLKELKTLNVSRNSIEEITGLASCTKLDTLWIASNRLGQEIPDV